MSQPEIVDLGIGARPVDDVEFIYVGDPMCSWCWGFAPVLDQIDAHYDLPVRTVVGGLRTGPAAEPMGPEARAALGRYWRQVAERTGQPFTTASIERDDWTYDTEPSCRAVVAMRELGSVPVRDWMNRLHRAFYVDGIDTTDPSVFPDLAAEFDLDPTRFAQVFEAESTRVRTREDFEEARSYGVTGFPTLLLRDGEQVASVTRGFIAWGDLEPPLTRILEERYGSAGSALVCDVDGGAC